MCRDSGWKDWVSEGAPGILVVPNTLKYCCMSRGLPACLSTGMDCSSTAIL